ncbi:MAG: cbb3-type cytochrome c oxidase N-terminal domain-containing protein [Sediminibacterium sp.]|jgi:cytochrome c oxidase cbb3-type subunit 3|nr:c-type cytochrome [Chitinophagaceae bacterium]
MRKYIHRFIYFLLFQFFYSSGIAQTVTDTVKANPKVYESEIVYSILFVVCLLAIIIMVLMRVLLTAVKYSIKKQSSGILPVVLVLIALLQGSTAFADSTVPGREVYFSALTVEFLCWILGLEILVILYLAYQIQSVLSITIVEKEVKTKSIKPSLLSTLLKKIYKNNTEEEILALDLGHNYDGIRELDNNIPIWWKYGFAISIVFAVTYLYTYHVAYSKPLQQEELRIDMQAAAARHALYLENAANNIDENNVKLLGADDIAAGKALFIKPGACATCHGENGSGIVNGVAGIGPNLTDDYWLHKGDIKAIFYTIKYGWPEKGMKSWKDDYSPKQIAQLASFVKSLKGTNPQPAKEKQGVLFVEDTTAQRVIKK